MAVIGVDVDVQLGCFITLSERCKCICFVREGVLGWFYPNSQILVPQAELVQTAHRVMHWSAESVISWRSRAGCSRTTPITLT